MPNIFKYLSVGGEYLYYLIRYYMDASRSLNIAISSLTLIFKIFA